MEGNSPGWEAFRDIFTGLAVAWYGFVKFMRAKKGTTAYDETREQCKTFKNSLDHHATRVDDTLSDIKESIAEIRGRLR
jgi:hypothetical protein